MLLIENYFQEKQRDTESKREEKKKIDKYEQTGKKDIKDLNHKFAEKLGYTLDGKDSEGIRDKKGNIVVKKRSNI